MSAKSKTKWELQEELNQANSKILVLKRQIKKLKAELKAEKAAWEKWHQ
jgi:hypothetical protein